MKRFFVLVFMMFIVFGSDLSWAQSESLRFEELIRQHFADVSALYTADEIDNQKIADFTERYADDGSLYKVVIMSNLSKNTLNEEKAKKEFVESLRQQTKKLFNSKHSYTIISIKMLEDGKKAEVHFSALLKGNGQLQSKDGKLANIALQSLSECRETFRYVDENTIKGMGSECKIDAIYEKPVPVQ